MRWVLIRMVRTATVSLLKISSRKNFATQTLTESNASRTESSLTLRKLMIELKSSRLKSTKPRSKALSKSSKEKDRTSRMNKCSTLRLSSRNGVSTKKLSDKRAKTNLLRSMRGTPKKWKIFRLRLKRSFLKHTSHLPNC